jgi:hypothetical protein
MGIYGDIIPERKQQAEKILGAPYDGSRYQSPSDCPPDALNLIADIKVMEAEDRQIAIMTLLGGAGSLTPTVVPPEKKHLVSEHQELAGVVALWTPHMSPGRKKAS